MTIIVGGLRDRLVHQSLCKEIERVLTALGWLGTTSLTHPVNLIFEPVDSKADVPLNTVAIVALDQDGEDAEIGSNLQRKRWSYAIDVYGASESLSVHLAGDISACLVGQVGAVGRLASTIEVRNWTVPTHDLLFLADVEEVHTDRAEDPSVLWRRYWRSIGFYLEWTETADGVDP